MEPTDFYLFVFPMGVLVGILVPLVFHYASTEERQKKKLVELIQTYMRNRRKQEKIFAQELEKLQALLRQKSIDKNTYNRLKKILEMTLTRKLENLKHKFSARSHSVSLLLCGFNCWCLRAQGAIVKDNYLIGTAAAWLAARAQKNRSSGKKGFVTPFVTHFVTFQHSLMLHSVLRAHIRIGVQVT